MYQIKDYRLKVLVSVKKKKDVRDTGFSLACMFGCKNEDMKVLDEKTGIEIPFSEFK